MFLASKINTYYHTLRYLKPIQVYYRGVLKINQYISKGIDIEKIQYSTPFDLIFKESIPYNISNNKDEFVFLNLKKDFQGNIDWNYLDYGRLWTYNLNYFEYLDQKDYSKEEGERLINDFIDKLSINKIGFEPYPISLRSINWIKFFVREKINNDKYNRVLYYQLKLLTKKLEYHLLGNHLLENAFALLFGAYYFNDIYFYRIAKKILIDELDEQVLKDGGHFELSPMYHSIILFRLLDSYNLISNNNLFNSELKPLIKEKCESMIAWLNTICFSNGDLPLLNDSALNIAPNLEQINAYAKTLGLDTSKKASLKESGYRKFLNDKYEIIFDIGKIGPDYQPGHSHADTFNFLLNVNNKPIIVDTGISTYEVNQTRFYERSTSAHNTVVVDNENSSQVWAGHRVAKRNSVKILFDEINHAKAYHDGYKNKGIYHSRELFISDSEIKIIDTTNSKATSFLHFHPNEDLKIENNRIIGKDYLIEFIGNVFIEKFDSYIAEEFNKHLNNKSIKVNFENELITIIR